MIKRISITRVLAIVALILLVGGLVQCAATLIFKLPPFEIASSNNVQQGVVFDEKVMVEYPSGWTFNSISPNLRNDPTLIADILAAKIQGTGPYVEIHKGEQIFDSLNAVAAWGKEIGLKRKGYQEISLLPTNINGEITLQRDYTWIGPSYPWSKDPLRRCIDSYRLEKSIGFILALCADDTDYATVLDRFKTILSSFRYLG